ncbi:MAG TPA: hypothetical protein VLT45_04520 [Kofleriaceae bacterium]|nr:hypothetical protein [Kofleriaceae bacterium]
MKLIIHRKGQAPLEVEADRVHVHHGPDHFELRGHTLGGVLVRIEEHDGGLTGDLAMFPEGGNSVRLKGGLR